MLRDTNGKFLAKGIAEDHGIGASRREQHGALGDLKMGQRGIGQKAIAKIREKIFRGGRCGTYLIEETHFVYVYEVINMKNRYKIEGETVIIYLNYRGEQIETVIDIDDFELVNSFPNTWSVYKTKYGIYVRGEIKSKKISLHRLIMGEPGELFINHIDRNTLNNRRSNLRMVTRQQNQQNQKVHFNSPSGLKGVTKKGDRWQVRVGRVYLGLYDTISEAEKVAMKAYKEILPYYVVPN